MPRADLLALTPDDLAALSNVGLAKRAQKEIESGELTADFSEALDGGVTARWSDGVECVLPANVPFNKGRCSCPATTVCRHLIRTALAYQKQAASATAETEPAPPAFWNPGTISDDALTQHYTAPTLNRARKIFDAGQVIEVACGTKPIAYFHSLALTTRFLVPGDVRYTRCDCAESVPCSHALLAVWAFRLLAAGQEAGVVETRAEALPIPAALLEDILATVRELAEIGLADAPGALWERLRRLAERARTDGLAWPADILIDIVQQAERYAAHDARFDPDSIVALVGELLLRCAAIRNPTGAVPQLFVRGSAQDTTTEVGTARLVGVGCGVRLLRKSIEIAAYMQNVETGQVVALRQEFAAPDPAKADERPFWQLAQALVTKSGALSAIGAGQLLIKSGKRSANAQLSLGRSLTSLNPQTFFWETLRPPLLVESFAELRLRLETLPPASLRPRRVTETLFVCPVAGANAAAFLPAQQVIAATVQDKDGTPAAIVHPYTSRGRAGCAATLAALTTEGDNLRFVSGLVRQGAQGLVIAPVALTFQQPDGRTTIQPWVAPPPSDAPKADAALEHAAQISAPADPIAAYIGQIAAALSDLWLVGLARADSQTLRHWQHLAETGATQGFVRLLAPVTRLVAALQAKDDSIMWDVQEAARALQETTQLVRLAQDTL